MYRLVSAAVLALISTSEAARLNLSSDVAALSIAEKLEEATLCVAENDEGDWDSNVPGLYDNSAVRILDGRNAKSTLIKGEGFSKPILVVAYHPQCPHCHKMVDDFKKLAQEVKDKKQEVEIASINMSMDHTSS